MPLKKFQAKRTQLGVLIERSEEMSFEEVQRRKEILKLQIQQWQREMKRIEEWIEEAQAELTELDKALP